MLLESNQWTLISIRYLHLISWFSVSFSASYHVNIADTWFTAWFIIIYALNDVLKWYAKYHEVWFRSHQLRIRNGFEIVRNSDVLVEKFNRSCDIHLFRAYFCVRSCDLILGTYKNLFDVNRISLSKVRFAYVTKMSLDSW